MRNRLICGLILSLVFCLVSPVSAAAETALNDRAVFLKQAKRECTITSAVMMMRRKAILNKDPNWTAITVSAVKPAAWAGGLSWDFSHAGMHVSRLGIRSDLHLNNVEERRNYFAEALGSHPEGIVIYNRSYPHAVLLTRYDAAQGSFYCADPANNICQGEIPLENCLIAGATQDAVLGNINDIWMIVSCEGEQKQSGGETQNEGSGSQEPAMDPLGVKMKVKIVDNTKAMLYSGPAAEYQNRIGSGIRNGETVYVYGTSKTQDEGRTWARINYKGQEGWVDFEQLSGI